MKAILALLLIVGLIPFKSFAGGISGGGGGVLPAEALDPETTLQFSKDSLVLIRPIIIGLQNERAGHEQTLYDKIIFDGQKKLWDAYENTKIRYNFDGACQDPIDGKDVDAAADAAKGEICFSIARISTKVSEQTAIPEIMALLLHEYAHMVGANEEQALSFQKDSLAITRRNGTIFQGMDNYSQAHSLYSFLDYQYLNDTRGENYTPNYICNHGSDSNGATNKSLFCAWLVLRNFNNESTLQDGVAAVKRIVFLLNLANWAASEGIEQNGNFTALYGNYLTNDDISYFNSNLNLIQSAIDGGDSNQKNTAVKIMLELKENLAFALDSIAATSIQTAKDGFSFKISDNINLRKHIDLVKNLIGTYKILILKNCTDAQLKSAVKMHVSNNFEGEYDFWLEDVNQNTFSDNSINLLAEFGRMPFGRRKMARSVNNVLSIVSLSNSPSYDGVDEYTGGLDIQPFENDKVKVNFFSSHNRADAQLGVQKVTNSSCEFEFQKSSETP